MNNQQQRNPGQAINEFQMPSNRGIGQFVPVRQYIGFSNPCYSTGFSFSSSMPIIKSQYFAYDVQQQNQEKK